VSWHCRSLKWEASIKISGKKEFLGYFTGEQEAASRYDLAALHRRGRDTKINFHVSNYLDAAGELVLEPLLDGATTLGGEPLTSKYNGVDWFLKSKKWRARIQIDYKSVHLGDYMAEEAAACVYDLAILRSGGLCTKLNFPLCEYTTAAGEVVYPPHLNRYMVKVDQAMTVHNIVSLEMFLLPNTHLRVSFILLKFTISYRSEYS
jgi:hypothetical protein